MNQCSVELDKSMLDFELEIFFFYLVCVFYVDVICVFVDVYECDYGLLFVEWCIMVIFGFQVEGLQVSDIVICLSMDKVVVSCVVKWMEV